MEDPVIGMFGKAQSSAILGALAAVIDAGPRGPRGPALIEAVAKWLSAPAPVSAVAPAALAAAFPEPRAAVAVADLLVLSAGIETEVSRESEDVVRRYAQALGVSSPWVELLPALRERRVWAVKRALFARSPDGRRILRRTWDEDGVPGLAGAAAFVLGIHRDEALAQRFRALGALGHDTLGRRFHDDLAGRGLAFPGEKGGLPERMIHHDLMHVVNGYGTDPSGECELAGFYAGFCSRHGIEDWFTFIVTALATFHLDMPVSPSIVTPARGALDPARVLAAFVRGRSLAVDVMAPWDYWSLMPLPLPEARQRLGLPR